MSESPPCGCTIAHLGFATTRELLGELRARIDVDYASGGGGLDYTTVGGRPPSNADVMSSITNQFSAEVAASPAPAGAGFPPSDVPSDVPVLLPSASEPTAEGRRLACGCTGSCPHSEYAPPDLDTLPFIDVSPGVTRIYLAPPSSASQETE